MNRKLTMLAAAILSLAACTQQAKPRYIWIDASANFTDFANSKENIAPTILSRLEVLKVNYHESDDFNSYGLSKEEYNEVLKDASEFLSKIELDNSNIILYNNSVILKKYVDKTNLITLIKVLYDCYHQKLFTNNVLNSKILKKLTIINDYLYKLQYNVNLSLLLSGLTLELGEVNE